MKRTIITLCTMLAMTSLVWGQNAHYLRGPVLVDNGITATATGTIAGLGNGNVIATLNFPNATGTTTCTSPGGNQSPGQNPATPVPVSGSALLTDIRNGRLSFTVSTPTPANPTPRAAGCPNNRWTAAFDNITFGNGTLTIQQANANGIYVTVLVTNVFL